MSNKIKTICVFCGSSSGKKDYYTEGANALGKKISDMELSLVYGGGNIGLMREVAKSALDGGTSVTGIIPERIADRVKPLEGVETLTVESMHDRKALMYKMSDAFIALPGGTGTLEELIEVITWNQLGYHIKPVGILNIKGYYNSLIELFDNSVKEGFLKSEHRKSIIFEDNPEILLHKIINQKLNYIDKWF